MVDKIVNPEQSAFISGREIMDGPLMLREMIDWSWIKACLESSRTSILVNGSPTSEFLVKRGLRQGDLLSPFLFVLVMEGLHAALMEATHSGLIRGINIGSSNIILSHIFYAYDVVFYLALGLKINIQKSNVYEVGVSDNEVSIMANNTGCTSGSFLFVYLGLPFGANMNLTVNWKILLDRFDARLSKWKANLLSIGGRTTLIKSVLALLEKNGLHSFGVVLKILVVGSSNYLHSNDILPSDSIRFRVGNGTSIRFWKDLWTENVPLYLRYDRFFRLDQDKDCLISDRFINNQWVWNWSRPTLRARNFGYLNDLLSEINHIVLSSDADA
ncbi:putative RNA-directed DNA polymerase, eukaryota, reverse transcriptase zinc-binding domain protein [Tanacetum coccineum]